MNTRHKALSAAVALSTALTLTAVPASAAPTTLATALAALRAAEAQVQTAIHDQATLSAAKWDAQMDAALAAEATAEANLRPFLVPPSATDFDVVHLFDYKAHGLTYKVELDPINGSTSAYGNTTNPIDNQISEYGSPCFRNDFGDLSGVCYGTFNAGSGGSEVWKSGVGIDLRISQVSTWVPGQPVPPSVYITGTEASIVGSNGQTYHPAFETGVSPSQSTSIISSGTPGNWEIDFVLPTGVKVVQVKWSNLDPNGETTTAVWNV